MPNPVVHWEIQAKDPKKIQDFYQKLFEWHIDDNNPMNYGMVDTHAEGGINGGIGGSPEGASSRVTFYAKVNDLQAYLDKAGQLGWQDRYASHGDPQRCNPGHVCRPGRQYHRPDQGVAI